MPAPLPALDPYSTLQLHPSAPRSLVVQAYLALLRRPWLRVGDAGGAVRALDEAYALLMDPDRRAEYDRAHQVAPPAADDLYGTLGIHPRADEEILRIGYEHALRAAGEHPGERRRIEDAYRTLSNPQLRARYDTIAAAAVNPAQHAAANGHPAPGAASALTRGSTGRQSRSDSMGDGNGAQGRSIRLFGRRNGKAPRESAAESRLRALRDPSLAHDEPSAVGEETRATTEEATAAAELVFVAGPHAGRRIALDGSPFVLEDLDDAGRRPPRVGKGETWTTIWRQGGSFMLRHPARKDIRIGGRRTDGVIVVLEDGDEIVVGPHAMRFGIIPGASADR